MEPRKGMLAVCSRGELGLILSEAPMYVFYKRCAYHTDDAPTEDNPHCPDCQSGLAWTGVHMVGEKMGQPWSSRNPIPVATLEKLFPKTSLPIFMLTPIHGIGKAMFCTE